MNIAAPAIPSTNDLIVPSINGLDLFLFIELSGNHKISLTALFIENLKTWSENFKTKTAAKEPKIKKAIDVVVAVTMFTIAALLFRELMKW